MRERRKDAVRLGRCRTSQAELRLLTRQNGHHQPTLAEVEYGEIYQMITLCEQG